MRNRVHVKVSVSNTLKLIALYEAMAEVFNDTDKRVTANNIRGLVFPNGLTDKEERLLEHMRKHRIDVIRKECPDLL